MSSAAVLLIEDDELIGEGLNLGLAARQISVHWVRTASAAWRAIEQFSAEVIVLDLGLPDADGMQVLKRLRESGNSVPVIILSARDAVKTRIHGLDMGADDYVVKPVTTDELAARIRAVTRRTTGRASEEINCGNVSVDLLAHKVYVGSKEIKLTPNEFVLLHALTSKPGQVLRIDTLVARMENISPDASAQSLKVHIHSLRKKLNSNIIQTVRGVGYMAPR